MARIARKRYCGQLLQQPDVAIALHDYCDATEKACASRKRADLIRLDCPLKVSAENVADAEQEAEKAEQKANEKFDILSELIERYR
jgi:hypothetical protein